MNKLLIASLIFLGVSGGIYWHQADDPSRLSADDQVAAYELQVQRGVAEKLIALNRLAKAEALSLHAWKQAEVTAQNQHSLGRADMARSVFSHRIFSEIIAISDREKARVRAYEAAYDRRVQEANAIRAAWIDVLGLDFQRYAIPQI